MLENLWARGKEFLGVPCPILCGAMTWISHSGLCRAVARNGAFPVLAGGNMPPDLFEQEVDRCLADIPTPFAVNLITIAPNFQAHCEIVQRKAVPFVIFAGSFPKSRDIRKMKEAGKKVLAFASEKSIASNMIRYGADALILEGSEAGGHIGYVSLTILLQEVLFNFRDFPIFVAGGIGTGRMMAHLLLMGAAGCQLGTRFVMSDECDVHPRFKEAFVRARGREAVSTPQYDSKLPVVAVRALKNKGMDDFGRLQMDLLRKIEAGELGREQAQFEVERYWVGALRRAVVDGDVAGGSLMAGQSVGLVRECKPIAAILQELRDDAEDELARVRGLLSL